MIEGWAATDVEMMRVALAEAAAAQADAEVPVGAVIAQSGQVIGAGHNTSVIDHDPSAHAEIVALRRAAQHADNHRLPDATLYVTLEPCVMCAGALIQARVARVVFGAYDPRAGALGSVLDVSVVDALNHRLEVNGGLLADECGELLTRFFEARR